MLSIIVPVLDEADNLRRLLPHRRQRCPNAEVIVVDGGSADPSTLAVRAWAARALRHERARPGASHERRRPRRPRRRASRFR